MLGADGYAQALAEHRQMIRSAFARYGGVEVGTEATEDLSEEGFTRTAAAGASLTTDEAVDYALEAGEEPGNGAGTRLGSPPTAGPEAIG